jgi:hypothetical protein
MARVRSAGSEPAPILANTVGRSIAAQSSSDHSSRRPRSGSTAASARMTPKARHACTGAHRSGSSSPASRSSGSVARATRAGTASGSKSYAASSNHWFQAGSGSARRRSRRDTSLPVMGLRRHFGGPRARSAHVALTSTPDAFPSTRSLSRVCDGWLQLERRARDGVGDLPLQCLEIATPCGVLFRLCGDRSTFERSTSLAPKVTRDWKALTGKELRQWPNHQNAPLDRSTVERL